MDLKTQIQLTVILDVLMFLDVSFKIAISSAAAIENQEKAIADSEMMQTQPYDYQSCFFCFVCLQIIYKSAHNLLTPNFWLLL